MGKLTDILGDDGDDRLRREWKNTEAAKDFVPLPAGQYTARIIAGKLSESRKKSTASYKLTFKVLEGECIDRLFWHDVWLTPDALPMAKRDLPKLGVTELEQLEQPLPAGIRCKVKLALRTDDDGTKFNAVRSFDVIGIDEPEPDAFAPDDGDAEPPAGEKT